ncbi:hypothetical protein GCM10023168_32990 [Fodinibacter luteus]|uniref:Uncharacterized protein n=1 Tax=Fodinibacter luteus TaxID=552064 RepID=A0ABP8KNN2_9MICO
MSVDDAHTRPPGASDTTVAALGKLSEALEVVEEARGLLYGFHRRCGMADLALGEAVDLLREAGHDELADRLETDLVGRNVLAGRWSFQVVEEYDDGYYGAFREHERRARDELLGGRRHVYEAEMKQERRTHGRPGHAATPESSAGS